MGNNKMNTINIKVKAEDILVYSPEEKVSHALWLIAPDGEKAAVWEEKTGVKDLADNAKAVIVCIPGGMAPEFYTKELKTALHDQLPWLSDDAGSRRLIGLGTSVYTCFELVFNCSETFGICVCVSPEKDPKEDKVLASAESFAASGQKTPRMVIADSADGYGRELGEKINAFGFGMHVHSERENAGWILAEEEVRSCMAHIK